MTRPVHLHIERVVLHGIDAGPPERLLAALERALASRIASHGLPEHWGAGRDMLSLGRVELRATEPEALAEAFANALLPPSGGGRVP